MCLTAIIKDMIWYDMISICCFFLSVLLIHPLSCCWPTQLSSHKAEPPSHPTQLHVYSHLQLLSDWCPSLPVLTHSSVKQLLAANLRCDSDMRCSAFMSETQCTQTHTHQSNSELFDTGVIRKMLHFCIIKRHEQFRSDTSICLAVMINACCTL
jgi:hypothetical protein